MKEDGLANVEFMNPAKVEKGPYKEGDAATSFQSPTIFLPNDMGNEILW